ncbi:Hypothetical predicted protein [Paramuricea clavata]|uniref:Uncharacterized protein n=1 Tax=Paramuricea clavata TaxID=317549 RepID=A0A7D9H9N3_PARCT|nr:Hypothetical predicted protein [Paramuricea clavata]
MADNMECDLSNSDMPMDMQINTEMDEVPSKRRYKDKLKAKDPGYRRRYDRRNAENLKKRGFAERSDVKKAFVSAIFASHSVGPNSLVTENVEDLNVAVKIPEDWKKLNAHGKRKLVIALVTNNGTKQPHWGDEEHRPEWWPSGLLFCDPSNVLCKITAIFFIYTVLDPKPQMICSAQFLADADRVDGLLALITDDDIYGSVSEKKTMKEKVSYVYQREVMKTSVDGRYSDFNTFSENFDTVCACSSKCQFVHNLDSAGREKWILCEQCLLCGEDCDDPVKLRRFFVRSPNAELKLFLGSLANKEVKSRRVTFFLESLSGNQDGKNLLKKNTGSGVFRDVTTKDYIKKYVKSSVENDNRLLMDEITMLEEREQYIFEVCVPEPCCFRYLDVSLPDSKNTDSAVVISVVMNTNCDASITGLLEQLCEIIIIIWNWDNSAIVVD